MVSDPLMVPQILARVGPGAVADCMVHLTGLAAYTFLDWDSKVGGALPGCLPNSRACQLAPMFVC